LLIELWATNVSENAAAKAGWNDPFELFVWSGLCFLQVRTREAVPSAQELRGKHLLFRFIPLTLTWPEFALPQ
jgi:hypothetical protein